MVRPDLRHCGGAKGLKTECLDRFREIHTTVIERWPTITPGHQTVWGRSDNRSAMEPIPPETITGTPLACAISRNTGLVRRVPSVAMSVEMIAAMPDN